jgi:hypothetical protein
MVTCRVLVPLAVHVMRSAGVCLTVLFEVTAGVIQFSSVSGQQSAAQFVCVTVPNHCQTSSFKFVVPEGSKFVV